MKLLTLQLPSSALLLLPLLVSQQGGSRLTAAFVVPVACGRSPAAANKESSVSYTTTAGRNRRHHSPRGLQHQEEDGVAPPPLQQATRGSHHHLSSADNKSGDSSWPKTWATVLLSATLIWSAPAALLAGWSSSFPAAVHYNGQHDNLFFPTSASVVASAKEMASASGSRVNKDPDSLLRFGLPINNKEVRKLQTSLEDIKLDIGSKRKSAALDGVKKAKAMMTNAKDVDKMKASCREPKVCDTYLTSMLSDLGPLGAALKDSQDTPQGSEQERAALDRAYEYQTKTVQTLSKLEEQMIPANYETPVPDEYKGALPVLKGRAVVEMKLVRPDASSFDVDSVSYKEATMKMVIDGYVAPITGGNFVDLVSKKFYDNMEIQRSDGFVVQTGDPKGEADGYVGKGSAAVGNGPHGERLIPLEIFVKGDKGPFYETTIEDEGRGGQATVLPFSSYGAMGWARDEYDPNSGSSQFFWLLFDSDLTPAGKNVLDGRYPCFGYVVEGADFLTDIKEGDIIVSAKVIEGAENLLQPTSA